jgi:hypothetical protein
MLLVAASAFAQAKPNFSGKWMADAEKTAAAMAGGGGGGRGGGRGGGGALTITMDATMLKIERENPNGTTSQTYKLDGSESKNMQAGRGGGEPMEVVSHAKLDGAKVVITTTTANGEQVSSWYMDGDWLVSERTTQNGAQKTYYKKGM